LARKEKGRKEEPNGSSVEKKGQEENPIRGRPIKEDKFLSALMTAKQVSCKPLIVSSKVVI
jgi:hypothetical protein